MFELPSSISNMIGKTTGGGRRRGRGSRRRHRGGAGSMPAAPTTGAMAMPSSMTASIKDRMKSMKGGNALSPGVYSSGPAAVGGGRSRRLRLRSTRTRRRRSRSHRAGGGRTKRRR